MTTRPRVTVAILAHNGAGYLGESLSAVYRQTIADITDIEVVVLDNGSTDGTACVLKQWPSVIAVHEPNNLGCSGGRNRLLGIARGDYVLLLDDDVVLADPSTIQAFVEFSRRKHDRCVLSAVLAERGAHETTHYGLFFAPLKRPTSLEDLRTLSAFQAAAPIDGCTFFHRSVVAQVGAFDAQYPFNLSDYDFGARASLQGIPTWILTETYGVHAGGSRRVDLSTWEWRQSYYLCGMVRTLAKTCRLRTAAVWIPAAVLWIAWRTVRALPRCGAGRVSRALLRSIVRTFRDVPSTRRARQDALRLAVARDRFLSIMPPPMCQNRVARALSYLTGSIAGRPHGSADPRFSGTGERGIVTRRIAAASSEQEGA